MTTAVLKNRLLDLTDRSFDEAHWGASSFMNFVSNYPDMLQVDESAFPPVVELYGTEADRLASEGDEYTPIVYHIRSDLWQAALDYSSGVQYVWDRDTKRAKPRHGLETVPIIDTVTADLQRQWRHEFRDLMTDSLELTDVELDQTAVRSKCRDRDWSCVERTTSRLRIPRGRPIQRANTEDATSLYRSIHIRRIGVWQVGDAGVPVIPGPKKSPNHYVTLRQFVRYKAFHCRIDPNKLDESLEESAIIPFQREPAVMEMAAA